MPFLYLYTRNSFYPGVKWHKTDWLFFIPALFYIFDLTPFFLSDNAFKISQMKANIESQDRNVRIEEGWLGLGRFHYTFMYIWNVALMFVQIRLIIKNRHILIEGNGSMNYKLFWFIVTLTALHIPLIFPGIFGLMFHSKWYTMSYLGAILSLHLIVTAVFFLFSPRILYGFFPQMVFQNVQNAVDKNENKPETSLISNKKYLQDEEVQSIVDKMRLYMEQQKPFLNQNYSIHDLSRDVEIPVYQLSPIINNYFQTNFNGWINKYRVNYFIQISEGDGKMGLTLDAIAKESGFTNRTTFTNAFKKEKGTTPGQFIKTRQTSF
jgi:AraC-like DNA-binding protein